jgi:DNA-binding transcriptional LysR family regulator
MPIFSAVTISTLLNHFSGSRPRLAASLRIFLALAKVGVIDSDTGDYLPPVKVDSIRMAKDIVLASNAVAMAPLSVLTEEIAAGKLVALPARPAWMQTGYGFVWARDTVLSPAAEAFRQAVWSVEKEIAVGEKRANGAGAVQTLLSNRTTPSRRR